jgi:lambda repressor-like predicted transcriptional regulator
VNPSPAVTLSLPDADYAAAVAADVLLGLSMNAGFTALAADRVRRDVHAAVEAAGAPLRIEAGVSPGRLDVVLQAPATQAARRAADVLELHGPRVDATSVRVAFVAAHRGSLRLV